MLNSNMLKEYKRLKSLFINVDEYKIKLVDELLKKAAFLKVELDNLELSIASTYVVQTSSKGNQRVNLSYRMYMST
jgi:16S rRNA G527 N7-methylase RsmG